MSNETLGSRQFEVARSRGSIRRWLVADDYVIENGHLVAAGDQARTKLYYPFASPEILSDFTELAGRSESKVLGFARKWGALGYSGVCEQGSPEGTVAGDPLDWKWEQAKQVNDLLDIINHRRDERDDLLSDSISEFRVEQKRDNVIVFAFTRFTGEQLRVMQTFTNEGSEFHLVSPDQIPSLQARVSPPGDPLTNIYINSLPPELQGEKGRNQLLAHLIVQEVINRIDEFRTKLVMPVFGVLVRSYVYECLLTVIYSFPLDAQLGEHAYLRCAYCGRYFQQIDKRQRYCLPQTKGSESLCSVRYRKSKSLKKRGATASDY